MPVSNCQEQRHRLPSKNEKIDDELKSSKVTGQSWTLKEQEYEFFTVTVAVPAFLIMLQDLI